MQHNVVKMSIFSGPVEFFGHLLSGQRREVSRLARCATKIKELEASFRSLDDAKLLQLGASLKQRHLAGASLDDLLLECFAAVWEAVWRALRIDTRDVQLMGALAMQNGAIAEMATGEGKSIAALYPAFLQSLSGKGVHVATLNPYLAERDHAQAQSVLNLLGCSCGLLRPGDKPANRRRAYGADVTYAAYNEFAQDYLRDNMQMASADFIQRGHASVILDEIDAILIDEARAPLTLSQPHEPSEKTYREVQKVVAALSEDMVEFDPNTNAVFLTEMGQDHVEVALQKVGLINDDSTVYDLDNLDIAHDILKALRARFLYKRNKDYVLKNDKIVLVGSVTGRPIPGRRLGGGLHQAIEAKEGLPLGPEAQILSSISVQNYFRLYKTHTGMTSTAKENAGEFYELYGLEVVSLPSHMPLRRLDWPDQIYQSKNDKLDAVAERILQAHDNGQPVLVGTTSISQSEAISHRLSAKGVNHSILTASHDADEAEVISKAGMPRAVTIAARMAGRGTDIQLGGPPPSAHAGREEQRSFNARRQAVLKAGGLLVIGTEKHDSRRIDEQLRGRAGRQGDIGASIFLLSLEDDILRSILNHNPDFFRTHKVNGHVAQRWAQSFLNRHQKNIELRHSHRRMQLMHLDDVIQQQRQVILAERLRVMGSDDLSYDTALMRDQVVTDLINRYLPRGSFYERWNLAALRLDCGAVLGFDKDDLKRFDEFIESSASDQEVIEDFIKAQARTMSERRCTAFGPKMSNALDKQTLLNAMDVRWNEHHMLMQRLQAYVGLRVYGKRDPLVEYRTEAFDHFEQMLEKIRFDVTQDLAQARPLGIEEQTQIIEEMLFNTNVAY